MSIQISISNAIGSRYRGSVVPPIDPDAQAFITAASITDPTQQSAINTLVTDLKGYGVWTKMKALYPFVGGTASQHKWNLKDPRDLNAAFRLVFNGGWTHSSTGATPNGTNAYADSNLNVLSNLSQNSTHLSVYIRTNNSSNAVAISASRSTTPILNLFPDFSGLSYFRVNSNTDAGFSTGASHLGLWVANRISSNETRNYRNTTRYVNSTSSTGLINQNVWLASSYDFAGYYSNQFAFASIGDGLTDTEAANFYTAVQTYQTTLGRSIGTQTVSDADAQAFVTNAGIVDQVEANAINNLVIGLKADGLWTKMKACYPMVGGSSSTMKYNLKNPLDTDAAFRLVFSGGWTFSQTGALPNGTNAFADTKLIPNTTLSLNSTHISGYLRTNLNSEAPILSSENSGTYNNGLYIWPKLGSIGYSVRINDNTSQSGGTNTDDIRGLHVALRTASNVKKYRLNNTERFNVTTASTALNTSSIYLAASRNNANYFNNEISFSSIGDGLTDAEAANLNTRVTTFQTALNRNV